MEKEILGTLCCKDVQTDKNTDIVTEMIDAFISDSEL